MGIDSIEDFAVVLAAINHGQLRDELSAEMGKVLTALIERSHATSKAAKGKLTLTLDFEVEPSGLVAIDVDVSSKTPKPLRASDHFYATKSGGLSRKDPRQQDLPLREVDAPTPELRDQLVALKRDGVTLSVKGSTK